ncbi:MAG: recombinase family protein, partial [Clostridia bacterium]|nr:recombinase family protein [Clostridia bacterium]
MAKKKPTAADPLAGCAVIYARYSSHNQRDVSIEQQVESCTEFAALQKLQVVEVYADKAVSGKTDRRPQFQRMMREAEQGKFRVVLAWKSNRMGRNMLDAMRNDARLRELGIACLYVEEAFDDTAAGRFALRSMMNVNQFYIENMAEDVLRGMRSNAEKGMVNGPLPLGYKKGADGRFAIDEAGAAVVREIYERTLRGVPFAEIAADLNARGIKTSRGHAWNKNSFHRILTNELYIGVYQFADIRLEDGAPAILSKELFDAVQEKRRQKTGPRGRRRGDNADFLLTGKLFCGRCGTPMVGISGTSRTGDTHHYYACQAKRLKKTCSKRNVRKDWLEETVAASVQRMIADERFVAALTDAYRRFQVELNKDSPLEGFKAELAEVKASIANLMRAIEQGLLTESTKERLLTLEAERKQLESTIALETVLLNQVDAAQLAFWVNSYRTLDYQEKHNQRELIENFVQAVYVYDGELRVVCNYTGQSGGLTVGFDEVDGV